MVKAILFNDDELKFIKNIDLKIKNDENIEDDIISTIGLSIVHSFIKLLTDEDLYCIVPNDYEEETRFLLSEKGGYLNKYQQIFNNAQAESVLPQSLKMEELIYYNMMYQRLIKNYYNTESYLKVNPMHKVLDKEAKNKYYKDCGISKLTLISLDEEGR